MNVISNYHTVNIKYLVLIIVGVTSVSIIVSIIIYSVPYSSLEINKLDETYKVGESITFLIKQEGCYIPCDFYMVKVFDEKDNVIWKTGNTFSRQESWTPKIFQSLRDVVTIREYEDVTKNQGVYTVKYSNRNLEVTQDFTVIPRK